jgi:hypothetical protein
VTAEKETFTIVAFRYNKARSVLNETYKRPETIASKVHHALVDLDADVISIRRVREEIRDVRVPEDSPRIPCPEIALPDLVHGKEEG